MPRLVAGFIMAMSLTLAANAEDEGLLSKLLAPGPTIKGHAKLEGKDCLECHDGAKGAPDEKCLACHKAIRPFVEEKRGFHGIVSQSCAKCHSDHKGRDFDTLAIDESKFQHAKLTGYDLKGKHAELKCTECHTEKYGPTWIRSGKPRYFGSQATCVSCHKDDDVHSFKGEWAKKDCASCHSLASWTENVKFDHATDAKFKLVEKHSKLKCSSCHGSQKDKKPIVYSWPQLKRQQCLTCHADFHKKNLSKRYQNGNCATCHGQSKWPMTHFDHQATGYALRGKHFELKCTECHKQPSKSETTTEPKNLKFTGLSEKCLTCHEDYHRFGKLKMHKLGEANKCQTCHNEKSFKTVTKFDHNAQTRYALDGKHESLDCQACHIKTDKATKTIVSVQYKWPTLTSKTCENCHSSPHEKDFSKETRKRACTVCHVTSDWSDMKGKKNFNHGQTRFPLTGAHTKTACNDCHGQSKKQVFKFPSDTGKFCVDCHTNIHKGQFSTHVESSKCALCHTTSDFKKLRDFDHSETRYPLEGAHKSVTCTACHKASEKSVTLSPPNISKASSPTKPINIRLSHFQFPKVNRESCLECHTDFHKGQLDSRCLNCHKIEDWKKVDFDHDKQTEFALRNKHKEAKCSDCHKPTGQVESLHNRQVKVLKFKPTPTACNSCHKDVHNASFGARCQECHVDKSWKSTRDFHKNFTLTGVHYSLTCTECHQDQQRRLSGLSQQCLSCHAKDDVHSGTLPTCGDCHRQQFWDITGFKHSLTNFPLRGAHRTLDCLECHSSGTYKGLNRECTSCHLQEALSVPSPNHAGFGNLNTCTACHLNQFSWR